MESAEDGQVTKTIQIERVEHARALLGQRDQHLRSLRDAFGIRVVMRGGVLTLAGEEPAVERAAEVVRDLLGLLEGNPGLSAADIARAIADADRAGALSGETTIAVFPPKRRIRPRTAGQEMYIRAIRQNDLMFCIGPAGTGKTYLAVAMAVSALKDDKVRKIILARPAVEAGEKLGFLPGDMQAKVNPYLRPLYDALQDMMAVNQMHRYLESDLLEVAPLAYMRGRTLDHAFIILDEGQNCTRMQMKMLLTRLGRASKCVVTGDISQIDLPASDVSGMIDAMHLLRQVPGIGFVRLTQADIVRHRLVQDIVDAYDGSETAARNKRSGRAGDP